MLASFGAVECWRELHRRHASTPLAYAAALVLACVVVNRPVDPGLRFLDDYNSALADMDENRFDRAQVKLERVLAGNPDNAETQFALGNLWLARGDRNRAKGFYRRTLQLDPQHDRVLNNLGVLAIEEKRWPLAEAFSEQFPAHRTGRTPRPITCWRKCVSSGTISTARTAALTEALRLRPDRTGVPKGSATSWIRRGMV